MARERPAQQEFFGIAEVLDPELGDLGVIKSIGVVVMFRDW